VEGVKGGGDGAVVIKSTGSEGRKRGKPRKKERKAGRQMDGRMEGARARR